MRPIVHRLRDLVLTVVVASTVAAGPALVVYAYLSSAATGRTDAQHFAWLTFAGFLAISFATHFAMRWLVTTGRITPFDPSTPVDPTQSKFGRIAISLAVAMGGGDASATHATRRHLANRDEAK